MLSISSVFFWVLALYVRVDLMNETLSHRCCAAPRCARRSLALFLCHVAPALVAFLLLYLLLLLFLKPRTKSFVLFLIWLYLLISLAVLFI